METSGPGTEVPGRTGHRGGFLSERKEHSYAQNKNNKGQATCNTEVCTIHLSTLPEAQTFMEHLLNGRYNPVTFSCLCFQTLQNSRDQCYQDALRGVQGSLINMSLFTQLVQRGSLQPPFSSSFENWRNVRVFCSRICGYIISIYSLMHKFKEVYGQGTGTKLRSIRHVQWHQGTF